MITDEGNEVCNDCGLEVNQSINNTPEWRFYKENDNNDQYVMAISYSKELLENMIQNIPSSKLEYCNYIIKESI